jgi:hypothetical protein
MSLLTLRNSYYNLRDNLYQLNEYHSEKVLEDTRINKDTNKQEDETNYKQNINKDDTLIKPKAKIQSVFANRRSKINANI